jgi:hypothetical protein
MVVVIVIVLWASRGLRITSWFLTQTICQRRPVRLWVQVSPALREAAAISRFASYQPIKGLIVPRRLR